MTEIFAAMAVVQRTDGLYLVLKRRDDDRSFPGKWCLPGGHIDEGERPEETVVRELFEETGIADIQDIKFVEVRDSILTIRNRVFKISVFKIIIKNTTEVKLSDEHTEYKFVTPNEAFDLELAGVVTKDIFRSLIEKQK